MEKRKRRKREERTCFSTGLHESVCRGVTAHVSAPVCGGREEGGEGRGRRERRGEKKKKRDRKRRRRTRRGGTTTRTRTRRRERRRRRIRRRRGIPRLP